MAIQLRVLPVVEVFNVSDDIYLASWAENVSIVCDQSCINDPSPVVNFLKVRISEAEEDFVNLNKVSKTKE